MKIFKTFATAFKLPALRGRKNDKNMAKILRVTAPFLTAEVGDKFELTENNSYSLKKNEDFYKIAGDKTSDIKSSFASTVVLSADYANELMDEGYLEEYNEEKKSFVNVFDEVDRLICKYAEELDNINETMKNEPEVLRLEKTTVLTNLIKVLNHLKNLKK